MALNWYDYYLLCALATGITISLFFALPVLRELRSIGVENSITQHPTLVITVTFLYATALAPIFIPSVFIPKLSKSMYDSIYRAFLKQDD